MIRFVVKLILIISGVCLLFGAIDLVREQKAKEERERQEAIEDAMDRTDKRKDRTELKWRPVPDEEVEPWEKETEKTAGEGH